MMRLEGREDPREFRATTKNWKTLSISRLVILAKGRFVLKTDALLKRTAGSCDLLKSL